MTRPLSALPALVLCLTFSPKLPTSFLSSPTSCIVNPRGHQVSSESYVAMIAAPLSEGNRGKDSSNNHVRRLSDEELLARFTRGFFGGVIFWPEKVILTVLGAWKMAPARFFNDESGEPASAIWESAQLPESAILPRKSTVFGVFQVTDSYLRPEQALSPESVTPSNDKNEDDYSYIDFSFATKSFGGSHRFSIHRRQPLSSSSPTSALLSAETKENEEIEFRCSSFRCNPTRDGEWTVAEYMNWFHQVYAQLLIADGLRAVMGVTSPA